MVTSGRTATAVDGISPRAGTSAEPAAPARAVDPGRICVIVNVASGRGDNGALCDRISQAFAALDHAVEIKQVHEGRKVAEQTRDAVRSGFNTIVAAGGDGTISTVAEALMHQGCHMGVIPLGTFNYFARSLDLPVEIEEAVAIIVKGALRPIRVATINDRVFLNNASLGVYPAILKTREDIYRRWGRSRIAAYWSVIKTLFTLRSPLRLSIVADGETYTIRTPLVFAVNNAYQLEQIGLEGSQAIAEGKMVLFTTPDSSRWKLVKHALALALGTATPRRDFNMIAARDIVMTPAHPLRRVARDGERERLRAPFHLCLVDGALSVKVPQHRLTDVR